MSHPAEYARIEKSEHPDRYCAERRCLWNVARSGACPRHPVRPVLDLTSALVASLAKIRATVKHTWPELDVKRDELFEENPVCSYCDKPILEARHAQALYRQRDNTWLLCHDVGAQFTCALWAIMDENQRVKDMEWASKAIAIGNGATPDISESSARGTQSLVSSNSPELLEAVSMIPAEKDLIRSRLGGASETKFFRVYVEQKYNRWLEAADALATGRENDSSSEPIKRMERAERVTYGQLRTAIELMRESIKAVSDVLTETKAPNGVEG